MMITLTQAQEIGFIERFALAENRDEVLKELIPGTEDYYFFHALHYQNTTQRAVYDQMIQQWKKRFENSDRRRELENRQALLDYERDPEATLAYLKEVLGLRFNHQRERAESNPDLATRLDPSTIALEAIVKRSLRNNRSLGEVSRSGIDWLMRNWREIELSVAQKRELLGKLERPDYPDLVAALAEDLGRRESRGFGEFPVHAELLLPQLDALAQARPELLGDSTFVLTKLGKLRPGADVDLERDADERRAYLDRAWAFVSGLPPAFHSLKAAILYQQLVEDRKRGRYDRERFLTYLQLPRPVATINPKFREDLQLWKYPVDFGYDCSAATGLRPIGDDERLVRDYLLHFLTGAGDYKAYAPYLTDNYLKTLLAEANIVSGQGDPEKWSSLLTPAAYQALKERVDIDFDPAAKEQFAKGETVSLDLAIKNVEDLIVKIYEINTANYYQNFNRELNTDLNLDGLIANEELTFDYQETPFRRVTRTFTFPQLDAPRGVWMLEFIGNGKSSRALIRKGGLQYLLHPSNAGHALRMVDENRQAVPQGYVWMKGKRYDPDATGTILIPFSNNPGTQPIILQDGQGFAALERLKLEAESYALTAGFYVDREALIANEDATVAVRPNFTLNGAPCDLALLEDVILTITSTDLDNVPATSTVPDFELLAHKETTHTFRVPNRVHRIVFNLSAKVKNLSQNTETTLNASGGIEINDMARGGAVNDLFFKPTSEGYQIQLLGRMGEPVVDAAIHLNIRRDDFRTDVLTTLKTDETGTVHLGALEGIYRVTATAPNERKYRWVLPRAKRHYPSTIHAQTGEAIRLPVMGTANGREAYALLETETVHGRYVRDHFPALAVSEGFLTLNGLPAGDYRLFLKDAGHRVTIRVTEGMESGRFLLSNARNLEKRAANDLQLTPLRTENGELVIQLKNANTHTRIHVFASRFVPAFDAFAALRGGALPQPLTGVPARKHNLYVSGRRIGDEYRYIIDRRYATKFPGNMLKRPGLLLNPWALRDTSTDKEDAEEGQQWQRAQQGPESSLKRAAKQEAEPSARGGLSDPHLLDFLAEPSVVAFNLAPDEHGLVRVNLDELGDGHYVRVLATAPGTAVERHLTLPSKEVRNRDLRLAKGLNPKRHFTQQDEVTLLEPNKAFVIDDVSSASFEAYETLGSVYRLFKTLSDGNATLEEFDFIVDWPNLEDARKRELYSKYASHELSFFISRKDAAFFEQVVRPYLANKKDLTFMDHYLLGHDLQNYLHPWRYAQLNVVERILLGGRLPNEREAVARDISDWLALLPPEQRLDLVEFNTALAGDSLTSFGMVAGVNLGAQLGEVRDELRSAAVMDFASAAEIAPAAPAVTAAPMEDGAVESKKAKSRALAKRSRVAGRRVEKALNESLKKLEEADADYFGGEALDLGRGARGRLRQFYRALEATKEWAENNYYHLPISEQNQDLVTVNKFWNDFAARDSEKPFISRYLTEPTRNFTEMMLALAVLDLPFKAAEGDEDAATIENNTLTLKPSAPVLLFHKEIKEAAVGQTGQLLVNQSFFRQDDRYVQENGEQVEKLVTEEFLAGVVYGCQVVVTNSTSSPQRLHLLHQVPLGAIPVNGGKFTNNDALRLEPYQTHRFEFFFYFPKSGDFAHFPVHVSKEQKVVAFAEPFTFHVVDELTKTDRASWAYVSQWGSEENVLAYLKKHNLRQTDLSKIAWRCRGSQPFFERIITLLDNRHHYDNALFSYGLHHNHLASARQYLLHADSFLSHCGAYLESSLVSIDPVERKSYQHLEYNPLVNARAYPLGGARKILNDRFRDQYGQLMRIFSYRRALDERDQMSLTVYLLLQDRVEEALAAFEQIDRESLATQIQYDYLAAYIAFYKEDPSLARSIADRYADYPVDRWRKIFQQVLAQVDEIEGKAPQLIDPEDRDQQQNQLAATEPSFTFKVDNGEVDLLYRHLDAVTVNYYRMDLEFLFSSNPFVSSDSARFSMIKPNRSDKLPLQADSEKHTWALPNEFDGENVLIEIIGAGDRKAQAHYSNRLKVDLSENYGQLQVTHAEDSNRPLAKVYVKVYADLHGEPKFYKDGYTDLRGKFDYASLNTNELADARRFSILVMSEEHGAVVREAKPPQR